MKSRNRVLFGVMLVIVMVLSGCSSSLNNSQQNVGTSEEPAATEQTTNADAAGDREDMVIGTIRNIKDSMFTITDELGASYTFLYEGQEPSGLKEVKDGDDVVVRYIGTVSTLEPFAGAILSVAPAT